MANPASLIAWFNHLREVNMWLHMIDKYGNAPNNKVIKSQTTEFEPLSENYNDLQQN